jgi:uncharacterized membrane protein
MVSQVTEPGRAIAVTARPELAAARSRGFGMTRVAVPAAVALGAIFFAVASWMAFTRHAAFNTGRFDLEIYTQVIWNTGAGHPFESTLLKTNLSHLAEHVALILIPIAWIYRLLPDPRLLLGLQQLALASIGWPLFWWARRALKSDAQALVVLACFYLTPALAGVALDDFHAVVFTTLPLAAGLALILSGRPRSGAAIALIALPIEEESALFLIGLGAFLFLRRERRLGVVVSGIAAVWLAAMVFVVMPSFHDPRTIGSVDGNRTLEHFAELRENPAMAVDRLFGERGRNAAAWILLPTGGLGVFAPASLLAGIPSFVALLLQDRDDTFGRHWVAPLLVAVWFATVSGLARVGDTRVRHAALGWLVVATGLSYWLVSPLPGGGTFDASALERSDRADYLRRAIERVPSSGVVVASQTVVAHLANRPEAYVFPIDSHYAEELGWRKKRPDIYVLDLYDDLTNRATVSERLNPLNADRPYHVWTEARKVLVLMDQAPEPTVPLEVRYGDRLLLKGYDLEATANGSRLIFHWERFGPLRGRYDRDLKILDARGNEVLYQKDMPLSTTYGSNKWQTGQVILDEVALPAATGPLTVQVAWVAQDKRNPFLLEDGSEAFEFVISPNG